MIVAIIVVKPVDPFLKSKLVYECIGEHTVIQDCSHTL